MSGLQNIPIRWPERYDPGFFDRIFREVLAKADIRNALEGTGITITGSPDEYATLSASADVQALLDASLLTATDESANLDNVRQLVAGDTSIVLTDGGAGGSLEITVGAIALSQVQEIPAFSVLGLSADDGDGYGPIEAIWTETSDTMLRYEDATATLNWGKLWAEVWPDSMCTALSGTAFDLDVTAMSLSNGSFTINGGTLVVLDATLADSLTLSETGTQSRLTSNTNAIAFYPQSTLGLVLTSTVHSTGGQAVRFYDAGVTDYLSIDVDGTDANLTGVNCTDLDIEGFTAVRLRGGANLALNTDDNAATAFTLNPAATSAGATAITTTGNLSITPSTGFVYAVGADGLRAYDTGVTDYVGIRDSGSVAEVYANTNPIHVSPPTGQVALINGAAALKSRTITATTGTAADEVILYVDDDTAGGAVTIALPAGASDRLYIIKKLGSTGNVTIDPNGAETIDGATTAVLSVQYESLTIAWNGTEWSIH